jgi:hypothetical protein
VTPLVLDLKRASDALSLEEGSRWLLDPRCPVPRVDMRLPGAGKPLWRWRVEDLQAWLATRVVPPGHPSPFA